jgi:ATP-dependent RNA helicase DDX51/DBP6
MFQVQRYDPTIIRAQNEKKKKKETASEVNDLNSDSNNRKNAQTKQREKDETTKHDPESQQSLHKRRRTDPPKLHVIAPKSEPSTLKRPDKGKKIDEAFDDLGVILDVPDIKDIIAEEDFAMETNEEEDEEEIVKHNRASVSKTKPLSPSMKHALHMTQCSVQEAATIWKLAPFLVTNLLHHGLTNVFPIQALVIPDVISTEHHSYRRVRDVCIAAPTGSGKTLAYVIPILHSLSASRGRICRLRALIVLPGRELAVQVHQVVQQYMKGSPLTVGLAVGHSDVAAEQLALTIGSDDSQLSKKEVARRKLRLDRGNLSLALDAYDSSCDLDDLVSMEKRHDWPDAVDILVCTPGRLVDHLDHTPHFSLQHLRFLVVDEADRLLGQSYHNWIDRVLESVHSASREAWTNIREVSSLKQQQYSNSKSSFDSKTTLAPPCPITWRIREDDGDGSHNENSYAASVCAPVQLRKFLVSATLTQDPQKLAALKLVHPLQLDVQSMLATANSTSTGHKQDTAYTYTMPAGLSEYIVECRAEQKPLALLALLLEQRYKELELRNASNDPNHAKTIHVVFTSNLESTHRLARLLQLLWVATVQPDDPDSSMNAVAEFSSALHRDERSELIRRCHDPQDDLSVVVCSDGMSRGMDLTSISLVINYDVPRWAKTYVHRCGRTARAGRPGIAMSLLRPDQVGAFRDQVRGLIQAPERVHTKTVPTRLLQARGAVPKYRQCVSRLPAILKAEKDGSLGPTELIPRQYWEDL